MKDNDQPGGPPANNPEEDDTFGLPEIQYEPIRRQEEPSDEPTVVYQESRPVEVSEPVAQTTYSESSEEPTAESEDSTREEEIFIRGGSDDAEPTVIVEDSQPRPSIWPRVFAILLVVLVAAAVSWYFLKYKPEQDRILAENTKRIEREAQQRDSLARANEEAARLQEIERRRLDSLANAQKVVAGSFTRLTERTGKYYVVIASAIDDDLLSDKASKLNAEGKACFLIPPFGTTKFSRLALDVKDTFADAQKAADEIKAAGEVQPWVMKY